MRATAWSSMRQTARCRCGVRPWPNLWRVAVSRSQALSCAVTRRRSLRRKMRHPVPGDVLPPADPNAVMRPEMLDKADQRLGAAGMTANAHMQSNRHHLGVVGALFV